MATTGTLPQLLTIDQLAKQLNVTVRHVRRLVAEKRVPYLKVGKFVPDFPHVRMVFYVPHPSVRSTRRISASSSSASSCMNRRHRSISGR